MRHRFPVCYQCEQEDCGAACLQSIMSFYGVKVSLETVKTYCSSTKNGLTMLDLNKSAVRLGFRTKAVRISFEELLGLGVATNPIVCYLKENHFVVV